MPRFQKWLRGVGPDMPADEVARAALGERLLAVSHYLDKCVGDADEAEAIHQLRVWTRRASAALAMFKPALPNSDRKGMKKTLRKVRRRAGAVRDCDVHAQRLQTQEAAVPDRIFAVLKKQRREARQRLKAWRRRLQHNDTFHVRSQRLLESVAWPKRHSTREPPTFAAFCRERLQPLAAAFFDLAESDLKDDKTLHALRIAGKRLRYALELAPSVIPDRTFQDLYQRLDEVQDRLGEVVDQIAAIGHIGSWIDTMKRKHRFKLRTLLRREEGRLIELRTGLMQWWDTARQSELKTLWQATGMSG